MTFKTGILLDNFNLPFEESLKQSAILGVDGIQFYLSSHHMSSLGLDYKEAKNIRKKIDSYNLDLSAICGDLGGHGFEIKSENSRKIEETKRIIDFAVELGTNIITTHIGVISETDSDKTGIMMDAVQSICRYAEHSGVYLAIETGPERSELLKQFIIETGDKHLKVNFDPANLLMVNGESAVDAVYTLKDYIIHTHAKDGRFFKRCNPVQIYKAFAEGNPENINIDEYFIEVPLGKGDIDFPAYLKALEDTGYSGYLTIEREGETDRVKDITDGVNFLKSLM